MISRSFLLPAVFLASCAAGLTLRRGSALQTPSIKQFISRVEAAQAARTSMSGGGFVTLRYKSVPLKATLNMTVGMGGNVRIGVSTDAGNELLAFAANPRSITLIDFQHRQFVQTSAGENDLAALSVPEIDARALAALLLSRIPCTGEPSGADETRIEYQGCLGGTLLATFISSPSGAPLLRELVLTRGTEKVFSARLLSHTALGFARRVELENRATTLVMQLDEIEPNPGLDEDLFTLSPPPGIVRSR